MRSDKEIREKITSLLDSRVKLKQQIHELGDSIMATHDGPLLLTQQATLGGVIAGLYYAIGHDLNEITDLAGDLSFFD